MLTELSIRNLAVIEHVRLSCRSGFHVLTGETGAGKSIVIDALSLIVGGRGSSDLVRHGCDKAEIEAQFELPIDHPARISLAGFGIEADPDEALVIRREITSQGKSASRINGQLVNLSMLREVGERLVNIHGQHEHQSLLRTEEHLHLLDAYGDASIAEAKAAYQDSYEVVVRLRKELRDLRDHSMQSLQMADLYRFQIEEIAAAKLKPDEDLLLSEERSKLANAEKLFASVSDAYDVLYEGPGGLSAISKSLGRLRDVSTFDPAVLNPLHEQLQSAYYQLEDAAYQLRDYRESIEFNPARLDQIERRLDVIGGLRKKYGATIADILLYLHNIQSEMSTLENKDSLIERIEADLAAASAQLSHQAQALSMRRREASGKLAADIMDELRDLHMERTQFEVELHQSLDPEGLEIAGQRFKFTREGIDHVEFMMSPNPGEPMRPLARIASGGELSRIMLALKTIFARIDRVPALVFDEVDTGVSGRAAQAIADKLSQLSRQCQVFAITHLPQVASMADAHYLIRKEVSSNRTYTEVTDLDESSRTYELARMIGGADVTDSALQHSGEMLATASAKKSAAW